MADDDKKPEETEVEETPVAEAAAPEAVVEETPEIEETPEVAEVEDEPVAEAEEEAPAEEPAPAPAATEKPAAAKPAAGPKKAKKPELNGTPPVVRAHAKYVRTSARKARLVCDHLRGKDVEEARAILAHTPRHVAEAWSKLLESAVANAEHNHELVGDDLRILAITADEGPTIKRFRPRAMGRATQIRKRTSHLSIALTPKKETR